VERSEGPLVEGLRRIRVFARWFRSVEVWLAGRGVQVCKASLQCGCVVTCRQMYIFSFEM